MWIKRDRRRISTENYHGRRRRRKCYEERKRLLNSKENKDQQGDWIYWTNSIIKNLERSFIHKEQKQIYYNIAI